MPVPSLPRPDRDGKISYAYLSDYIQARYEAYDEMFGDGARGMFNDLRELGLINDDLIDWTGFDDEGDEE